MLLTYLLLIKRSMYLWKKYKKLRFIVRNCFFIEAGSISALFDASFALSIVPLELYWRTRLQFPSKFQNIAIHVQLAILLSFWDHADSPPGPRWETSRHISLHTTQSTHLLISLAHFLTSNATHDHIMRRNDEKSVMRADCSLPSKICIYNLFATDCKL